MSNIKKENNDFCFSKENLSLAEYEINKYPKGREGSAIISILWIAQKQNKGWLTHEIINYIAKFLDLPQIRVMEIATFYSMFNLTPVGAHHFQMCGTTPCMLSGSDELKKLLGASEVATHKSFMVRLEDYGVVFFALSKRYVSWES